MLQVQNLGWGERQMGRGREVGIVATKKSHGSGKTDETQARASGWAEDPAALLRVGAGFRLSDTDPNATPGVEHIRILNGQILISKF